MAAAMLFENPAQPSGAEVVLGVDTHKDVHVAVVLSALGVLLASRQVATTPAGYHELITWARSHGRLDRAGVEGTGSYGAALTRILRAEGVQVIEVNRPDRSLRRRRGKSDLVDAEAAARAVLSTAATAIPKAADGPVEAMRVLKIAKDSAVKARVQALNQLKAVLVSADPALREALRPLSTQRLITRCADLDIHAGTEDDHGVAAATAHTLRQLARRIQYLTREIRDAQRRIAAAVAATAPRLLELDGIGPDAGPPCSSPPPTIQTGSPARRPSPLSAASARSKHHPANRNVTASTGAETAKPTPRSTVPSSSDCDGILRPGSTRDDEPQKACRSARSSAA